MNSISPQDIALFKNVTLQDDDTAKTFLFRYSNVDTAIARYFESQEPVDSPPRPNPNPILGPPTNSNTFLQPRGSLPKKEPSGSRTEPTTAPTTEKKILPRQTIDLDDDSLGGDFSEESEKDEAPETVKDNTFNNIMNTLTTAIHNGMNSIVKTHLAEFMAVVGCTEGVARTYLSRYGTVNRALDEYFRKEGNEIESGSGDEDNKAVKPGQMFSQAAKMTFNPLLSFARKDKVKKPRRNSNKEQDNNSDLALRLRGNYDAYVKKHLKADLLESSAKEWPKFLGSLLVECRINTQDFLSKMKIRDELRFEPEEIEYTSTNITKRKKNEDGVSTKVVVGKNWYIKGSSLNVRCIWKDQFVGYLSCEYEEAFVFLLNKKYVFLEGIIVDSPEVGKPGDLSAHGANMKRGFSGFDKIKVQLDVFMTEEVIKSPLNIVAIPGRRRGGVKSTRSAKPEDGEDSKEAQQMYQLLRLAKESFAKVFNMLKIKVTIPTIVQVRQRFDPFQRIKREKYGFKARGRQRYFMNSCGVTAEVIKDDFREYYPKGEGTMSTRSQSLVAALQRMNTNGNRDLSDDENDDDFNMDDDEDNISVDSSSSEPEVINYSSQNFSRGSTMFEERKRNEDKNKQNQDLFNMNQVSSYYRAAEPPSTLKSTLHIYQRQALSWMQYREGLIEREDLFETKLEEHRQLNDLFQEMTLLDGSKIYYNPFNGEMSVEFPTLKACKGGILADEMGLGKTVMTIALLHAHNRKTVRARELEKESEDENNENSDESEAAEDNSESESEDEIAVSKPRKSKPRKAKRKPLKGTLDNFVKVKKLPSLNKKRQAKKELSLSDDSEEDNDHEDDEDYEVETTTKKLKVSSKKGKAVGKKSPVAYKKPTPAKLKAAAKAAEAKSAKSSRSKPAKKPVKKAAAVPKIKQAGTLIVLPLTVLSQWETEIKNHSHTNTLSVLQYYGDKRKEHNLANYDIVLTTYGTLESENSQHQGKNKSPLFDCHWFRVILDEAHYIKGRQTKTTKAACTLQADYRWCLTGTPLQNRLDDMFSLMQFLKVDTWGEYFWWNTYINKYTSHDEAANLIRGILKPLILRRTKKSTYLNGSNILELPGKDIKSHFVKLTHEERAIYNCFFQGSKQQFNDLVTSGTIQYEYAHVFELLIRLRQVCDHPSLVFSKDDLKDKGSLESAVFKFLQKRMPIGAFMPSSNKQDTLTAAKEDKKEEEKGEEVKEEEGKMQEEDSHMQSEFIQKTLERLKNKELEPCCICLEEITDPAIAKCGHIFCKTCLKLSLNNSKKCPLCQDEISMKDVMSISLEDQDRCRDLLDSSCSNFKKSSKLAAVIDTVHEVAKRGEKVVIFSQFIGMLNLIERFFKEEKISYRRIDGSSSMKERTRHIDDFNIEKDVTAFLISLKAGAIGLNLTVATNVFLVDPWWNPAIEDQAIERVHRIGQKSEVNVVRFVCEKTIEERIQQLNAQKKDMINRILQFNPQEQKKQNLDNMMYVMRGFDDE